MLHWKHSLLLVCLLAAVGAQAEGTCDKGLYPPNCYPCLGCEPCNDGSGDYCDTAGRIDGGISYTSGQTSDLDFSDGSGKLEIDSVTVTAEVRPRTFSFGGRRADPFLSLGFGQAGARFSVDGLTLFDDNAKIVTAGAGVRVQHWSRWGAELGFGYRTLFDSGTTTVRAEGKILDTTIGYSSFDAGLLIHFTAIPDRLTLSGGVRTARGDLDVERTVFTEGRPFTFDESVDADRDVVVAGAEVRITPRLTAEAEFSTDGETSQSFAAVRFSFGGPRRIAETAAIMSRSVDLGCVPRRTGAGCTEEGWGCLVMFPENDWPQYRAALGNPPVTLDGTATVRDGRLHYEFKAPLPADVTSIPVDRDTPLQNPIARSLGFEHLIIAAGNYAVNRAVGRHGSVDFEINLGTFPQVGARPKLKFKHASPGCNDPLGLCLIIPLRWTSPSESLTPEEVADGFGFGTMEVVDGKLYLTPHRPAALPDGTLPIDEDKRLEPDLALALGYKSITIKRGVYRMNMAYGEFGRAVMDIDVTPLDPPAPTAVPCSLYSHTTGFCKGCGVACNDGTNYPMNCAADIFTGPMGNVCGGQHHRYNRNEFGTPQLYRGVFDVSELDAEFHTYDPAGADSCANSATARFTQYVPRQ